MRIHTIALIFFSVLTDIIFKTFCLCLTVYPYSCWTIYMLQVYMETRTYTYTMSSLRAAHNLTVYRDVVLSHLFTLRNSLQQRASSIFDYISCWHSRMYTTWYVLCLVQVLSIPWPTYILHCTHVHSVMYVVVYFFYLVSDLFYRPICVYYEDSQYTGVWTYCGVWICS